MNTAEATTLNNTIMLNHK